MESGPLFLPLLVSQFYKFWFGNTPIAYFPSAGDC